MLKFCFFLVLFTSCYQEHLYVQRVWVGKDYPASAHVGTPDPGPFPHETRLLIAWRFPPFWLQPDLHLNLTVRYFDEKEELICIPVSKAHSYAEIPFPEKKLLTYKIDVMDGDQCLEEWQHHFWTQLIDFKSSSVSSQPMQASVIDMP